MSNVEESGDVLEGNGNGDGNQHNMAGAEQPTNGLQENIARASGPSLTGMLNMNPNRGMAEVSRSNNHLNVHSVGEPTLRSTTSASEEPNRVPTQEVPTSSISAAIMQEAINDLPVEERRVIVVGDNWATKSYLNLQNLDFVVIHYPADVPILDNEVSVVPDVETAFYYPDD